MKLSEVHSFLCIKDAQNPDHDSVYGHLELEAHETPIPRKDCYCDNCFYGRDKLALEIIQLTTNSKNHK